LKKNSLLGNNVLQKQETIQNFCNKIKHGKYAQVTDNFMVISRIESLILEKGLKDAIERAKAYIEAGSDGIMIHSRQKKPDEVLEFCRILREINNDIPIVVVPTSYNQITAKSLSDSGINIVIYANHMLRASYPGMLRVAKSILDNDRSLEAEKDLLSIEKILNLIPGTR
jgi:phosphoenolpyruvate phosphomutase